MISKLRLPRGAASRNLVAVCVGSFFAAIGFSLVSPLMPLFTLELLDGDLARVALWVGIAMGVSPLLTAFTGPWWGSLGDRYGQRVMIQRSLLSIGAAIAVMAVIDHPWQLVGLRGAIGVLGGISVACLAAITASSTRQALGRNIGLLQASQTLGMVAGPLIGGGLALAVGMRASFLIAALLFALGFALVTWLYRNPPAAGRGIEGKADSQRVSSHFSGSLLFWATLVVLFAANFVDGSFMVMLPLYLPTVGAPAESLALIAGLGLSGAALAMAIASAVVGRISNRFDHTHLILGMLGGAALILVGIVMTTSWWQFIALRVLLGLVAGGLPTIAYAAAAGQVPASRRGAVVGVTSSAGLLGWAVAPLMVGFVAGVHPRAVFATDLLLVVGCGLTLILAQRGLHWRGLPEFARDRLPTFSR